jgi:PAS domain S-box-containing protein
MEEVYKSYFDSMPCFLTVQDRDLRVIHANERFRQNFGSTEGRYCYQVYKQRPERCENCSVEKTFRTGNAFSSEELVRTLDGREVWVIVNTTPIRNEAGEIVAVMEMSTDITDIKMLHKQLADSQERYRILFEEVPCYISIQDENLRIVDANRFHREAFGTAFGSYCFDVYKHRDKECQPCLVRQTFKDGQVRMHEEVVTNQNDEPINVLVCTAPVRNADGQIERVIEMSTDITQIRQLQDKLTSVGLLIGSISHGIKGLLNGLDGGIYLVNSGLKKNDQGRITQGWDIALRNVERIRSMVMDILYYAKDREPDFQQVDVADFLSDVCGMFKDKADKLDIDFEYAIAPGLGQFEADRQAVRSLLVNLIENSMDACRIDSQKDKHWVKVNATGEPEQIVCTISDNGIGMDRETREKAFSLFFSSKGAGGTGLGLFISNKIAKAHGGRLSIESEDGHGSTFTVTMPRQHPQRIASAEDIMPQ